MALTEQRRLELAWHEAGHALYALSAGFEVAGVQLGWADGENYTTLATLENPTADDWVHVARFALAGLAGERLCSTTVLWKEAIEGFVDMLRNGGVDAVRHCAAQPTQDFGQYVIALLNVLPPDELARAVRGHFEAAYQELEGYRAGLEACAVILVRDGAMPGDAVRSVWCSTYRR